jgi:hypothetical protein
VFGLETKTIDQVCPITENAPGLAVFAGDFFVGRGPVLIAGNRKRESVSYSKVRLKMARNKHFTFNPTLFAIGTSWLL